jgi:hypothetical protein
MTDVLVIDNVTKHFRKEGIFRMDNGNFWNRNQDENNLKITIHSYEHNFMSRYMNLMNTDRSIEDLRIAFQSALDTSLYSGNIGATSLLLATGLVVVHDDQLFRLVCERNQYLVNHLIAYGLRLNDACIVFLMENNLIDTWMSGIYPNIKDPVFESHRSLLLESMRLCAPIRWKHINRYRILEICIALQELALPALQTLAIIDHLSDDLAHNYQMYKKCLIITKVKHFHSTKNIKT